MSAASGLSGSERPTAVFYGLVTIISAISLELLISRVADVVRAAGWTPELALLAVASGLMAAYLWAGYSSVVMIVGATMSGRDMVSSFAGAAVSFASIQLVDAVASPWLFGLLALTMASGLERNARTLRLLQTASRPLWETHRHWVPKAGMAISAFAFAAATASRLAGGGEVVVPVAIGISVLCWAGMLVEHLRWWDEVRHHVGSVTWETP